jgi:hypothetical protein
MRGRSDGDSSAGSRPETPRSAPETCGEIDIRIARDGSWFYHSSPISRKPLVKLFSGALRRESDGSFALVTPVEHLRIRVDDAPFLAVAVEAAGHGKDARLTFTTNVDDEVSAGPDHPIRVEFDPVTGEPSPYVTVRQGLEALIARSVYYELVALGVERDGRLGVWSNGAFFALGEAPCAS